MAVYKIDLSIDNQKCEQCGKIKKGCYKKEGNDYWICQECILKNIKEKSICPK